MNIDKAVGVISFQNKGTGQYCLGCLCVYSILSGNEEVLNFYMKQYKV